MSIVIGALTLAVVAVGIALDVKAWLRDKREAEELRHRMEIMFTQAEQSIQQLDATRRDIIDRHRNQST